MKDTHFITIRRIASIIAILLVVFISAPPYHKAQAANLTSISDTLSTLVSSADANHTIYFVTPTGVESSTDTITIDFTDFTTTSVVFGDIDLAEDNDANCDGSWTEKTLAGSAAAGTWGALITSDILTLTPPTDASSGEIDAGYCVQVEIGTHAAGPGTNQINNPGDTNAHTIEIAGNFGDDGKYSLDFVADDSVNVTSTVDPSITFAISDTAIGFGTLVSANARWATADALGAASDSAAAHTISIGTNATDGYIVTYYGATLTSGSDTIDVAGLTDNADGNPGTEEFAMGFSTDGDTTIPAGYDHNATPASRDWTFVASTLTTIASETVPTATETISAFYLGNIAANTEAGVYSTNITYIATATF
ncbi:hypothetical protein KKB10_02495 [Patescibacteria group bacterium]|nr:hypothetical protein [Patescibacteria group bacterium]MBU1075089.1 hypothetical protein [Patescibacteria group bacterium]MBU1952241.1 hypothetical protein [Patescibacteria group bacterium]